MELKRLYEVDPVKYRESWNYVYDVVGCCQEVHRVLGPWLSEMLYQDALQIALRDKKIPFVREYSFTVNFHKEQLGHLHKMDFLCKENIVVECKAVEKLSLEHRQQLWNYMRLAKKPYGILYNFAPGHDQCEKYYLPAFGKKIFCFNKNILSLV